MIHHPYCWWFRNPAITCLRLVVGSFSHYPQGFFLHPNGGWEWDFWTINSSLTIHWVVILSAPNSGSGLDLLKLKMVKTPSGWCSWCICSDPPVSEKTHPYPLISKMAAGSLVSFLGRVIFLRGELLNFWGVYLKKPTNKAVLMLTSQNVPKYLGELNPLPQLGQPDMSISHGEASGPNK